MVEEWYGIRILNRKVIPDVSPFYEPWMLPEEESGEGVKDFWLREGVNYNDSIAVRNAINFHCVH